MVDYNAYWETLNEVTIPFEDVSQNTIDNSGNIGLWIALFSFVIICFAFILIFVLPYFKNK